MDDLGLPYGPKTRQVEGRDSEKRQAKKYGARLHPMSGAGSIKDDASTPDVIFEFKDVAKTHTMSGDSLNALYRRACQEGKDAYYVVTFGNGIKLEGRISKEKV